MQGFRDTIVLTMDFKSILLKNQDVEEVGVSANNFTSFNCRIRGDCREPCIFQDMTLEAIFMVLEP